MTCSKRVNSLNWGDFIKQTQRRFKKAFCKHISSKDIKRIWDDWIEDVTCRVLLGDTVQMDKYSTLQIIGIPIEQDQKFYKRLLKGKMVRRDGVIVDSKNGMRKDYKYKVVYRNSITKKIVLFKADPKLSRRIREKLNNTTIYYKIQNGN